MKCKILTVILLAFIFSMESFAQQAEVVDISKELVQAKQHRPVKSVTIDQTRPLNSNRLKIELEDQQEMVRFWQIITAILFAFGAILFVIVVGWLKFKHFRLNKQYELLKLTVKDLRHKIKIKKVARYIPSMKETSVYAVAYIDLEGNILSANRSFNKNFGDKILVGDNWDNFFAANFMKNFTQLKNKMVLYTYKHNPHKVYAISSKLKRSAKGDFRICEIVSFDANDLANMANHYKTGREDNAVDLEELFEQAFIEQNSTIVNQSLMLPTFRSSSQRFIHIGADNAYKLAVFMQRFAKAVAVQQQCTKESPLEGSLSISFNQEDNCILEMQFFKINLKGDFNNYFIFEGKKQTLAQMLEELDKMLDRVGLETSVILRKFDNSIQSVVRIEVVDMFAYQLRQGVFNIADATMVM